MTRAALAGALLTAALALGGCEDEATRGDGAPPDRDAAAARPDGALAGADGSAPACEPGADACGPHASCVETEGGGGECVCEPGWALDGAGCADVDECTAGTADCHADATCTNTEGGFTCACDDGFTGDGTACADVDECASGAAACGPNATCTNTEGGFECVVAVEHPGEGNDIRPALEAAWERAAPGDTIVLPAGSFAYSGGSLFAAYDKPDVRLRGAGSGPGGTRLYRETETDEWMMRFYCRGGGGPEATIEISDIWFQAMKTRLHEGDTGTGYPGFRGVALRACDFYLHDCRFQWFSARALGVSHVQEHGRGLVYDNEFVENLALDDRGRFSRGYGINVGVWGDMDEWVPVSPGTDQFVFIEDNYFTRLRPAVGGAYGALYVFRHNVTELTSSESASVDMHPALPPHQADYPYSSRFTEIYDNVFIGTPEDDFLHAGYHYGAISFRGGGSVIHGNTFRGFPAYSIRLWIGGTWYDDYYDFPPDYTFPGYPVPYQIGYESGAAHGPDHTGTDPAAEGRDDCFIWDNTYEASGGTNAVSPITFDGVEHDVLREGRDYHFAPRPDYTPYPYPHPRRR
jgi:hypothetical protein